MTRAYLYTITPAGLAALARARQQVIGPHDVTARNLPTDGHGTVHVALVETVARLAGIPSCRCGWRRSLRPVGQAKDLAERHVEALTGVYVPVAVRRG